MFWVEIEIQFSLNTAFRKPSLASFDLSFKVLNVNFLSEVNVIPSFIVFHFHQCVEVMQHWNAIIIQSEPYLAVLGETEKGRKEYFPRCFYISSMLIDWLIESSKTW